MPKLYTIQQISKLFGVPKSTLRYWQQEGILPLHKGENGYRQFSMKDMLELSDVMFYRELQMPVRFLKQLHQMDAGQLKEVLQQNLHGIDEQMEHFKKTRRRLKQRIAAVENLQKLLDSPYQDEEPDCEEIIQFELTQEKTLAHYLKDQYRDVLLVPKPGEECIHGLAADGIDELKEEARIWRRPQQKAYKACLVQIPTGMGTQGDLPLHRQALAQMGYHTGQAIMRYLATVAAPAPTDCYHAWIEVF